MGKSFAEKHQGCRRNVESALIDKSTGEIVRRDEGTAIYVSKPKLNAFKGFMTMGQPAADAISEACARRICGIVDMAVLWRLISLLDQHNYLLINQAELAKSLSLQQPNVARSIRKLTDLEILLPGPKAGVHRTYRLNPQFGWRGPNKQHQNAIVEELNRRGLSVIEGGKFERRMAEVKALRQQRLEGKPDDI